MSAYGVTLHFPERLKVGAFLRDRAGPFLPADLVAAGITPLRLHLWRDGMALTRPDGQGKGGEYASGVRLHFRAARPLAPHAVPSFLGRCVIERCEEIGDAGDLELESDFSRNEAHRRA